MIDKDERGWVVLEARERSMERKRELCDVRWEEASGMTEQPLPRLRVYTSYKVTYNQTT